VRSRELQVTADEITRPELAEGRTYRLPLPPHPIAAEQARALVRLASTRWDVCDLIDDVLIVTVELVTNAAKSGEVFELAISWQAGAVLIEVWDSSEAAPDRQRQSLDRVDGRGLLLVEACSKDWDWRLEDRGGKTVWAIVGAPEASLTAPPSRVRM
jgi:anti-sigma regulatory factor (Ser/Thr protein kinase)